MLHAEWVPGCLCPHNFQAKLTIQQHSNSGPISTCTGHWSKYWVLKCSEYKTHLTGGYCPPVWTLTSVQNSELRQCKNITQPAHQLSGGDMGGVMGHWYLYVTFHHRNASDHLHSAWLPRNRSRPKTGCLQVPGYFFDYLGSPHLRHVSGRYNLMKPLFLPLRHDFTWYIVKQLRCSL